MIETPRIAKTSAQEVARIHLIIPREQVQAEMGPGIQEVIAVIAAQGVTPTGPWLTHHLRMDPGVFDFEICVPVSAPVSPSGRVEPGQLRAATVVRTVHRGSYAGLGAAWKDFGGWIAEHGLKKADDMWECYLVGPDSTPDPTDWRTELNQPLASA